jgi:tripartite ATP-independent transporter DctM subunit
MSPIAVLFGSFFGMCLIGVPIAFSLLLSSFLTAIMVGMNPIVMIQQMYVMLDSYTLLAVPLFLMIGNIMDAGDIVGPLVRFSGALVGHVRGGLGQVNVVANMIVSGISGSATAEAAGLGSVLIRAMKKEGYPADVAAAVNAAAATLGPIIPPSIMMIVYGAYGNLSISALFIGGAIPGLLFGGAIMLYIYVWALKNNFPKKERRASLGEIWATFKSAFFALMAIVIIIVGVISGLFTATEAGMVGVIYCLIISFAVYKSLDLRKFKEVLGTTLEGSAQVLLCVAAAGSFGFMMAFLKVPALVLELAGPIAHSYYGVLFFFAILFTILGCFMDATPAIIIFMPIIQSLSNSVGLNPYFVGDLICIILCIGFITPPYGLTLLISAGIAEVPVSAVIRKSFWIYVVLFASVLILIFFPEIILWLPRMIMPETVGR